MPGASEPAKSATAVRKDRERSLQLRVSLDGENREASRRLVRKIRSSIARTLEQETGPSFRVSVVVGEQPEASARPDTARTAAPGCGAWWNF